MEIIFLLQLFGVKIKMLQIDHQLQSAQLTASVQYTSMNYMAVDIPLPVSFKSFLCILIR